jgi:hypothetical protein
VSPEASGAGEAEVKPKAKRSKAKDAKGTSAKEEQ